MKINTRYLAALLVILVPGTRAGAQTQPTSGNVVRDMIIEDSLTPAKMQLRDFLSQLSDTLVHVESVQSRLQRARAAKMVSVVVSEGRQLARNCLSSAAMIDVTTKRLEPLYTRDPRGDQALQVYRAGLATLNEDMRLCAHFDSLSLNERPLNQEKLENIATAASEAVYRYDQVRDGLLKLLGISLPIRAKVR